MTVSMRIRLAWWLQAYLGSVALMSRMTGLEPDWGKMARIVASGVRVEPVRR